jgi:hypothetical protein
VLLSAQAAPALRAVADILAVKVQGTVQAAPAPKDWIEIREGETYTVPNGQILTARYGYAKNAPGGNSTMNLLIKRNGETEGSLNAFVMALWDGYANESYSLPDGLVRFQPGDVVQVEDSSNLSLTTGFLVGYLAPAQ